VELLSREGEIAIAKRIEAGREAMIAGLCESPLTFQAIIIWRDELNDGKVFLRDIIDLEATYAGPDAKNAAPAGDGATPAPAGAGLAFVDHLTHNVHRGRMAEWAEFYERLFNFREIRYFDIEGKLTGLKSKAMTSPCGKIRIPINESADEKSQIEEYLRQYKGEGIQHIAVGTDDIYGSTDAIRARGLEFMPGPPDLYYERSRARVKDHREPLERLKKNGILIDGEGVVNGGTTRVLLQIFSKTVIGPIFFEFIQRKGDEGFGEGNFKALFESIEEDQIQRGVLKA